MESDDDILNLAERYKLAVAARNKLTDDYHKWMTFYYLATSAFPLAIVTLYKSDPDSIGILALAFIGTFISTLWYLSCKGYYYWSKNWIKIIIRYEKILFKQDENNGVYSVFSGDISKNHDRIWPPLESANISTPKLSLLFSFISIWCWIIFWGYFIIKHNIFCKYWIDSLLILLIFVLYLVSLIYVIPKHAISLKDDGSHVIVDD